MCMYMIYIYIYIYIYMYTHDTYSIYIYVYVHSCVISKLTFHILYLRIERCVVPGTDRAGKVWEFLDCRRRQYNVISYNTT